MELKDFIVLTLAGGLGCWALSLLQIFWGGDSESDSETTPRGKDEQNTDDHNP